MAAFVFAVGEPMVKSISMENMPSVLSTGMMHNSRASAVSNYPKSGIYSFQSSYITLNLKSRK